MELEQLKETWDNAPINNQPFNNSEIEKMMHKKYNTGMKKIIYPEIIGTIICLLAIVYILLNFQKLDNNYFRATGIISILLLAGISLISLLSLKQLNINQIAGHSHLNVLKSFVRQKILFSKLQRINVLLCYALLLTSIILMAKIFNNYDIIKNYYFWSVSIGLGYIFLLSFSRYVNRTYNNTIQKNEDLLKEFTQTE